MESDKMSQQKHTPPIETWYRVFRIKRPSKWKIYGSDAFKIVKGSVKPSKLIQIILSTSLALVSSGGIYTQRGTVTNIPDYSDVSMKYTLTQEGTGSIKIKGPNTKAKCKVYEGNLSKCRISTSNPIFLNPPQGVYGAAMQKKDQQQKP